MFWDVISKWDRDVFVFLNNLPIESYDTFWLTVTNTYFWIPLFAIFLFLIVNTFRTKHSLLVVLFGVLAVLVNSSLMLLTKSIVMRLRPNNFSELEGLIRVLQSPDNYSFYSGHASNSFAITVFVVLVLRRKYPWSFAFFAFPVLFSLSRIFVGVHYPSDLLVGTLVGAGIALLFYKKLPVKTTDASTLRG